MPLHQPPRDFRTAKETTRKSSGRCLAVATCTFAFLWSCGSSEPSEELKRAQEAHSAFLAANRAFLDSKAVKEKSPDVGPMKAAAQGGSPMAMLRYGLLIETGRVPDATGVDALLMYEQGARELLEHLTLVFNGPETLDGLTLDQLRSPVPRDNEDYWFGGRHVLELARDFKVAPQLKLRTKLIEIWEDILQQELIDKHGAMAGRPERDSRDQARIGPHYPPGVAFDDWKFGLFNLNATLGQAAFDKHRRISDREQQKQAASESSNIQLAFLSMLPVDFDIWEDGFRVLIGLGDIGRARELRDKILFQSIRGEVPEARLEIVQSILDAMELRVAGPEVQHSLRRLDEAHYAYLDATAYLDGSYRPRNTDKGQARLREAAALGSGLALIRLGMEAEDGRLRLAQEESTFDLYERAGPLMLESFAAHLHRLEIGSRYLPDSCTTGVRDVVSLRGLLERDGIQAFRRLMEETSERDAKRAATESIRRDPSITGVVREVRRKRRVLTTEDPLGWRPMRVSFITSPFGGGVGISEGQTNLFSDVQSCLLHSFLPEARMASRVGAGVGEANGFMAWIRELRPPDETPRRSLDLRHIGSDVPDAVRWILEGDSAETVTSMSSTQAPFGSRERRFQSALGATSSQGPVSGQSWAERFNDGFQAERERFLLQGARAMLARHIERFELDPMSQFIAEECVGLSRFVPEGFDGRLSGVLVRAAEQGNETAVRALAEYYAFTRAYGKAYFWANVGRLEELREMLRPKLDPEQLRQQERSSDEWWSLHR